ncbi:MAG: alpha/beta hydrolase [Pseudomonadota bacterium]
MSTRNLLDPEVAPVLDLIPEVSLARDNLPVHRQTSKSKITLRNPAEYGTERQDIRIPGLVSTDNDVRCLIYRPVDPRTPSPAYIHFHGGGYLFGSPDASDDLNLRLSKSLGLMIVSVDYRLAPEHPAPAAIEDGYTVLQWLHNQADKLGVDRDRIAVGGESAGGGVAAALAQYAHSRGEFEICFQLLTYPMLDDRTGRDGIARSPVTGEFVWNHEQNQVGWGYYLGDSVPAAPQVPARASDLSGLPPAWIGTAALDLFRDENIEYAQRLLDAGVAAELIVYPGTFHGFQMAAEARVTKQFFRDHMEALQRGLTLRLPAERQD